MLVDAKITFEIRVVENVQADKESRRQFEFREVGRDNVERGVPEDIGSAR
jgi:hypothetical protein